MVGFARSQAGDRADAVEWNVLVQFVKVTGDRLAVAAEELANDPDETMSAEEYLQSPFILIGTVEEIAAQILRQPGPVRVHLLHRARPLRRGIFPGYRIYQK